jgi:hypothetical protein
MKNPFLKLLFIVFSFWSFSVKAQFPPSDSSWKLVFVDEFDTLFNYNNKHTVDTSKWTRQFPWGQNGDSIVCGCDALGNNCHTLNGITYYTLWDDTANYNMHIDTIGSGILNIIARENNYSAQVVHYPHCDSMQCDNDTTCCPDSCISGGGQPFCVITDTVVFSHTTGMLFSKYKFRYGYYEMRFKLPEISDAGTNEGIATNWWMFGGSPWDTIPTPKSEIDMFELLNSTPPRYTTNVHYQPTTNDSSHVSQGLPLPYPIDSAWHISALEWGPDRIDFYLDGIRIRKYPNHPDSLVAMNMLFDLNVNPGNFCRTITDSTLFPRTFQVDYIKVYQLKLDCDSAKSICVYDPATYAFTIAKSLTLGGDSCISPIPTASNTTFRAVDFIRLNEGVSVDDNTEMLLDVVPCQPEQTAQKQSAPGGSLKPPPKSFLIRKTIDY